MGLNNLITMEDSVCICTMNPMGVILDWDTNKVINILPWEDYEVIVFIFKHTFIC